MKRNSVNDMCKQNDFRRLFGSCTAQLHWLCYTLTGDEELTSKVLDAALEQSLKGADGVFREWMLSWARRLTIKVCIAIVRPAASNITQRPYFPQLATPGLVISHDLESVLAQPAEELQRRLLQLDAVQRFVFVLRALEGYSRRDTALLLELDDRTCEWTYSQAAWALQAVIERRGNSSEEPELVSSQPCSIGNTMIAAEQNRSIPA